ncbi:hypothetical protein DFP73DRAFT_540602 [Morchella snyderi]|nr:hypothetical protein DFP73DRAFT_540602 [Morchella snyderi]
MLKVVNRSLRAKNQAARVLTRWNERKEKAAMKDGIRQENHRKQVIANQIKASRMAEKEDRLLGPIAPRRAITQADAQEHGTVPIEKLQPQFVPAEERIRYWNIVPGDRVVLLKGHDRHKIGVVKSLDKKHNVLTVKGVNMVPILNPDATEGSSPVFYMEAPVKFEDVRLVYPLPDPETGIPKDTIIANIKMSKIFTNKKTKARTWERLVPGMEGVTIPWPEKEARKHADTAVDTKIYDVDSTTFKPTLLIPPMPAGVIDELRNKYSKFRTRHDQSYIDKKTAEEKARLELAQARVLTPVQELNRKLREERKALGKPVLSDAMLEKIGRVMAQNRPELLAGVQAVPAGEEAVV